MDIAVHPRLLASLARHFGSRCTIQAHDGTHNTSGQLSVGEDHWANVEGMVDIPCRKAPMILARPTANERRSAAMSSSTSEFQVVLCGKYNVSTTTRRAVIDGQVHGIVGIEPASDVYTRLRVERMVPARD